MAKRLTPEERYVFNMRKQQRELEEFAAHEIEWADDLLLWYKIRKEEIPDDEYRAVAYFKNKEWMWKPGSLPLCFDMYRKLLRELPESTKETAFFQLAYRYKVYALALAKEGY